MQPYVKPKQKKELSTEAKSQLDIIRDAIDKIFQMKYSNLSFEELYRTGYNLVINQNGDALYETVKAAVAANLTSMVQSMKTTSEPVVLLNGVKDVWQNFNMYISVTSDILMYMERNYISRNRLMTVMDTGSKIYRETVLERTGLLDRLHVAMMDVITKDRNGEYVEKGAVKETAAMLMKIGVNSAEVYERHFEVQFLEATRHFYTLESQQAIATMSCPDFLQHAEHRLLQETGRCEQFLDRSTSPKLRELMLEVWLRNYAKVLLAMETSGLDKLIEHERLGDIARLYRLFTQDPTCKSLLLAGLVQRIKAEGEQLSPQSIAEGKKSAECIEALMGMKDKYHRIWIDACRRDKDFELPFKQTFDAFLNVGNTVARALAGYSDYLLRERIRQLNDDQLDSLMDKTIGILQHVQSKDMFEEYYNYHLSRRLLGQKCASDDAERRMISKLRAECGTQYTQKMDTMLKDMATSAETMVHFAQHHTAEWPLAISVDIKVLTQGNWPVEPKVSLCNLPGPMDDAKHCFTDYYMKCHNGRVLNWKLHMGDADLHARLGPVTKLYEITTTTYQAVILMLFNDYDELLVEDIAQKTQIPDADLKRNLVSLRLFKLLVRANPSEGTAEESKEIRESDIYRVNDHFVSKYLKMRVPFVVEKQVASKPEPLQKLESSVEDDRGLLIDATLVKIMKARKKVEHGVLIADTIKLLSNRFAAQPAAIKNRIELLIEKEYIERAKQDRRLYLYNA